MSATKTFINYKSPVNSFTVANERFLGLFDPGRIRGFDEIFTTTPGLVFGLSHELTGINKVGVDGSTEVGPTGVLLTRQGTIAHFEEPIAGLAVNANPSTEPRIDVVFYQHAYQESTSVNLGSIGIQEGTPGAGIPALPLPTTMIAIGYVTILDSTVALTTANWTPTVNKTLGGFEYLDPEVVEASLQALALQITQLDQALTPVSVNTNLKVDQLIKTLAATDTTVGIYGATLKTGTLLSPKITGTNTGYADYTVDPMYFYCDGAILYYERPTSFGFGNPGGTGVIFLSKGNAQDPTLPSSNGCAFATNVFETRNYTAPSDTTPEYMILTDGSFKNYQLASVNVSASSLSTWSYFTDRAAILCTIPGKLGIIDNRRKSNIYFRTNTAAAPGITGAFKYGIDWKLNKLLFKDSTYYINNWNTGESVVLATGLVPSQVQERVKIIIHPRWVAGLVTYITMYYTLSTSGDLSALYYYDGTYTIPNTPLRGFEELEFWLD